MADLWVSWTAAGVVHLVTVVGFDRDGHECYRTYCGKRVYASVATRVKSEDDGRPCPRCSRPRAPRHAVPPPASTWSRVHRFDLVDSEEY